MAVNTMTFNQLATVLNSIVSQATGVAQITPTDTSSFVSVAKVGLETGYDPLMNAISQVLSRTIFSNRPYSAKFKGLMMDSIRYGNHVRKIQLADNQFEEDDRIKLTDGSSIDQYKVKKPKPLQTNIYGENIFEDSITIFRDQLDVAFSGPEEFGQFISMVMQNMSDRLEQARENVARATLANFIAGKTQCDTKNVIYLLDKYEDETGLTGLTSETIKQPENFVPFAKWLFGYLKTVSDLMTERSSQFHKNFTISGNAVNINRHTPLANQKVYLYSKELNNIDASVLSSTFHDDYLKIADHESVNFWQSIDTPMGISVTAGYSNTDGTVGTAAVVMSNVFGVIFDEEAIGLTQINSWSSPTPFNARGGYSNIWYHETLRTFCDFTENGVVLILDHSDRALQTLTVTSEAGEASGKTAIASTPTLPTGATYAYKIADTAQDVHYGMPVVDWTAWNGTDEITATSGKKLTLVWENSKHRAVGAGSVTVVSNDEEVEAKKKK